MTPQEIRGMPVDFGGANYREHQQLLYLREIAAQLAEIKELLRPPVSTPEPDDSLSLNDKQQEEEGNEPPPD